MHKAFSSLFHFFGAFDFAIQTQHMNFSPANRNAAKNFTAIFVVFLTVKTFTSVNLVLLILLPVSLFDRFEQSTRFSTRFKEGHKNIWAKWFHVPSFSRRNPSRLTLHVKELKCVCLYRNCNQILFFLFSINQIPFT